MSADTDKLIESLRSRASQLDYAGDGLGYYSKGDAALDRRVLDRIAILEAERDDARQQRNEIGRAWDEADARAKEAEARAASLEAALAEAREALEDAEDTLRLVERPAFRDPRYGDEVEALGLRIGFGALMASASASWREHLSADGDPVGGEFVAGPCHSTVVSTLAKIRRAAALSSSKQKDGE